MLEAPITMPTTFNVKFACENLIQVGNKGGNLRLRSKQANGDPMSIKFKWVGSPNGQTFRLHFFGLSMEDDPSPTAPFWPFKERPIPAGGLTDEKEEHIFTLEDWNHLGKYSVIVGNLHLDPVIIIER
jgi:hypothetical protein